MDDNCRCAGRSRALARGRPWLARRYRTFSRARLCRVAWWSLVAWVARRSVRLVVGHTGRVVFLPGPGLSLSRSVCSIGRSGSARTAGCAGAATNSSVVLLREALRLLPLRYRVPFRLENRARNTSADGRTRCTSTSRAISGVKYERETTLHHF